MLSWRGEWKPVTLPIQPLSTQFGFTIVDRHCFSPKHIKSDIPQGSVLPSTLLFSDDLSKMNCPIHSYVNDSTLHFSPSFDGRLVQQE